MQKDNEKEGKKVYPLIHQNKYLKNATKIFPHTDIKKCMLLAKD